VFIYSKFSQIKQLVKDKDKNLFFAYLIIYPAPVSYYFITEGFFHMSVSLPAQFF